jgi:putative sterol carrier protein
MGAPTPAGVDDIAATVRSRLAEARPDLLAAPCVYHFHLQGANGGDLVCRVGGGRSEVTVGRPPGQVTCTITMTASDALGLVAGHINPVTAYFQGRFKVDGDFAAAARLGQLLRR